MRRSTWVMHLCSSPSSSTIVLAVWTELDANHARLLTDVAAKLDGEIGTYAEGAATLPDGLFFEKEKEVLMR